VSTSFSEKVSGFRPLDKLRFSTLLPDHRVKKQRGVRGEGKRTREKERERESARKPCCLSCVSQVSQLSRVQLSLRDWSRHTFITIEARDARWLLRDFWSALGASGGTRGHAGTRAGARPRDGNRHVSRSLSKASPSLLESADSSRRHGCAGRMDRDSGRKTSIRIDVGRYRARLRAKVVALAGSTIPSVRSVFALGENSVFLSSPSFFPFFLLLFFYLPRIGE